MFEQFKSVLNNIRKAGSSTTTELTNQNLEKEVLPRHTHHPESEPEPTETPVRREDRSSGITFPVDDVVAAADPLWLSTLGENLELRSGSSILIMPDQSQPALAPEGYFRRRIQETAPHESEQLPPEPLRFLRVNPGGEPLAIPRRLARTSGFLHPLVQAIHLAFSEHRPLVLSPDGIWLTIVQGFGHHVHEHAEALRGRIVRHEGKKKLTVPARSLEADRWPDLIAQFSAQIRDNSDPVLHETLLCDFSTTTPGIRTAYEVALMDVYERYFEYLVMCVCGIPEITLEGTVDDWQRMRDRIEVLATYDLDWWISRLAPILEQFIAAAKGHPDREFWKAIYKPEKAYATDIATGWITDLFPYIGDPPKRRRNHVLNVQRRDWLLHDPSKPLVKHGVGLNSFPCGLSRALVGVQYPDNSKKEIDLMGGFFGVGQHPEDNALCPVISWAAVDRDDQENKRGQQLRPVQA